MAPRDEEDTESFFVIHRERMICSAYEEQGLAAPSSCAE